MPKYESQIKQIPHATAERVYQVLANLETFRPLIENAATNQTLRDKIAAEGHDPKMLEKLRDVQITNDSITFPIPMLGSMTLAIVEREENRCVKMQTAAPVAATLWLQMLPTPAGGAKLRATLSADLNMMMKMMIGKKLEKGLDQFADMLATLPYNTPPLTPRWGE